MNLWVIKCLARCLSASRLCHKEEDIRPPSCGEWGAELSGRHFPSLSLCASVFYFSRRPSQETHTEPMTSCQATRLQKPLCRQSPEANRFNVWSKQPISPVSIIHRQTGGGVSGAQELSGSLLCSFNTFTGRLRKFLSVLTVYCQLQWGKEALCFSRYICFSSFELTVRYARYNTHVCVVW